MPINRREFCQGAAIAALATAALGASVLPPFPGQAWAETVATDELMKPAALPDMTMGSDKAPVTIVEYASMTCPHCAHFQETTFPELKKRYIDTGKARYILREFPLDTLAEAAFMLARCSGQDDSSKYYSMVDTLFHQQRSWAVEKPIGPLMAIAKQAGFTEQSFQCLPGESEGAGWHRKRAPARHRQIQSALDADLFHQWDAPCRRLDHRGNGQGDRPLSQGRIRVFWPGAATAAPCFAGSPTERSGKPRNATAWQLLNCARRFILPPDAARQWNLTGPSPGTDDDLLNVKCRLRDCGRSGS